MRWPWTAKPVATVDPTVPVTPPASAIKWVTVAFIITIILTYVLIWWRLNAMDPNRWCALAKAGSPEIATGCIGLLGKLIDGNVEILNKAVILAGILSICLAVVALRVNFRAGLPGGGNIDIGADRTTVTTPTGQTITIPTPPSTPPTDTPITEDGK